MNAPWARRRSYALATLVLAILSGVLPAAAQYEEEDDDWAEQDRRYQERYEKKDEEPDRPPPPAAPEEARQALMAEFLAEADELIRARNYLPRSSEHFRLKSDDPRVNTKVAVDLLESFYAFFDGFWSGRTETMTAGEKAPIYLFYSYYKFNKLLFGNPRFGDFRPAGHYRQIYDVVVIHSDGVPADDLPNLLVHETAHLLVARRLFPGGTVRAPWILEGLAAYFEYTERDRQENWLPGKVGGKGAALVKGAGTKTTSASAKYGELRSWIKSDEEWSLDAVLRIREPAVYYGDGANGRYAASWLLVHYLFHGNDGAHAGAFVRYLEREAREGADTDSLYEMLDVSPRDLQEGLLAHAKKLRM